MGSEGVGGLGALSTDFGAVTGHGPGSLVARPPNRSLENKVPYDDLKCVL